MNNVYKMTESEARKFQAEIMPIAKENPEIMKALKEGFAPVSANELRIHAKAGSLIDSICKKHAGYELTGVEKWTKIN